MSNDTINENTLIDELLKTCDKTIHYLECVLGERDYDFEAADELRQSVEKVRLLYQEGTSSGWKQYPDTSPTNDNTVLVLFRDSYYLGFYSYKDQEFYIKAERGYNAIDLCQWQELPAKHNADQGTQETI